MTIKMKSEGERLRSSVVFGDWAQGLHHMAQILPGRQSQHWDSGQLAVAPAEKAIPFRVRDLI